MHVDVSQSYKQTRNPPTAFRAAVAHNPWVMEPSTILNGKILVVDDQELTARMLAEMLQTAGYSAVSYTTDAREVCDLHRENHYDLILLDMNMPGKDGFQVMAELNTLDAGDYLPVMALTAQPAYKLHALKAGAKDFIAKPFDPEEALTRIRNMLEVRLLHDEALHTARTMEAHALHDALTGLANRRLLTDRISAMLANARRNNSSMAIVFLDLDDLKRINDTLGHAVGDTLLKMVAARLSAAVREEDTVARLGGDEFVVALWDAKRADDAVSVASKLIKSLSTPYAIEGTSVSTSASAGIAIYPIHGTDADELLKRADQALYAAKRAGKNAFRIAEAPEAPARS